jgi:hypothetical protein
MSLRFRIRGHSIRKSILFLGVVLVGLLLTIRCLEVWARHASPLQKRTELMESL